MERLDWNKIDTVLLDMDGTLLDLRFDNHFWRDVVPRAFAEKHQLDFDIASEEVTALYEAVLGELEWYCLDYWTGKLNLDIRALKSNLKHLIKVRPGALEFMQACQRAGKKTYIITNAHPDSLTLKLECTQLHLHLDDVITSHDIGYPKEKQAFWQTIQQQLGFDKHRSLFIDDSETILNSAQTFGINYLCGIERPDSTMAANRSDHFYLIEHFDEINPPNSPK